MRPKLIFTEKLFSILEFTSNTTQLFMLIGGLCYLFGVIFYAWKKFTYHHAVWHVFVLAGSIMHFFGVWYTIGNV